MALSFREFTNLLNKAKCLPEIAKPEASLDAVSFLQQLPVWGLCVKKLSLLARERRYSPATGSAGFASKSFGHVACPPCQPAPVGSVGPISGPAGRTDTVEERSHIRSKVLCARRHPEGQIRDFAEDRHEPECGFLFHLA